MRVLSPAPVVHRILLKKSCNFFSIALFVLFVIPVPFCNGINSSRACTALDAGNPVSKIMVPCFRRDGVWIPVCTGMTEPGAKVVRNKIFGMDRRLP